MAQITEIIMAILGLCGTVSLNTVCIVILCCEVIRIVCDIVIKQLKK